MIDKVKETGQEALEHGKQVAQEAAQSAQETVKESGQEHAQQVKDSAAGQDGAGRRVLGRQPADVDLPDALMATQTKNRPPRPAPATAASGGPRPARPGPLRPRPTSTPRRSVPTRGCAAGSRSRAGSRRSWARSLPTAAAKKAAPSSKKGKAGGLALAAAAAGMAFKNRGKLSELRRKETGGTSTSPTSVDNAATPPATPAV